MENIFNFKNDDKIVFISAHKVETETSMFFNCEFARSEDFGGFMMGKPIIKGTIRFIISIDSADNIPAKGEVIPVRGDNYEFLPYEKFEGKHANYIKLRLQGV